MAIVTILERKDLERDSKHSDVQCTYAIVDANEKRYLQIDTYGSAVRKMPGKKSQSLRFSPEAVKQLKEIINKEF